MAERLCGFCCGPGCGCAGDWAGGDGAAVVVVGGCGVVVVVVVEVVVVVDDTISEGLGLAWACGLVTKVGQ